MNENRRMEEKTDFAVNRGARLLYLYQKLMRGEMLQKKELAERFGVSTKTVQRDIDDLRTYLADNMIQEAEQMEIRYSKTDDAYVLAMPEDETMTEAAVLRIGRALTAGEALDPEDTERIIRLLMRRIPVSRRQKLSVKIRKP